MTDEEKAKSTVNAYPELRNSALGKAVIVDTITLLKNEREEILERLRIAIGNMNESGR